MDLWTIVALLVALVHAASAMVENARLPPGATRKLYREYFIDVHEVTSADGYKTKTFRINYDNIGRARGWPVLLVHSFGYNSDAWFHLGEESLPCVLALQGYDVWVHSVRGSRNSKGHTRWDADKFGAWMTYWRFSFHEMAVEDLPVTIDHILKTTNRSHLSYVGHGMGGTMIFILLSDKPQYNAKIKGSVTLVPTVDTYVVDWGTRWAAKTIAICSKILNELCGGYCEDKEEPPKARPKRFVYEALKTFEYVLNRNKSDGRRGGVLEVFGPDTRSMMTVVHLCQIIYHGKFRQYDLGTWSNKHTYNHFDPPEYRLQRVSTPQLILYSENDEFINLEGARSLCKKVPGKCERVYVGGNRHHDFIKSKDAKQRVYDKVARELHRYLPPIPTTTPPPVNPECLVSR